MMLNRWDDAPLTDAFGIRMSSVDGLGVGAGWGVVAPGRATTSHRHDETECFVVVAGQGVVVSNGERHPVGPGTVALFEPFEAHVLENTGERDLVFLTQYWRDADRALTTARATARGTFEDRPVFVFSTPPTPNGDLHLGHLSGPYLGADAFVRFQRMNGTRAWHLTGSDDFQSYVTDAALREGRTPAETAAHYSAEIAATLALLDVVPDQYTVTATAPGYRDGLRGYFTRIADSAGVTPTATDALFDAETGRYLYEVDVSGDCPVCKQPTNGNICEECGEPNTVADLLRPRAANGSAAAPRRAPLTRWTLPLHDLHAVVTDHQRRGRTPARLKDLATRLFRRARLDVPVTHPADWGVTPAEGDTPGQVIWVWPEMSYGFLHGIQALGERLGESWSADRPEERWKIVHFFGYDNSFYHSVLYPALYHLAHPGWEPDIDYHVNEFYLLEGSKFSTSRRHAVWGKDVLTPRTVDAVRYHLCLTRPETERTDYRSASFDDTLRRTLIGTWQKWLHDLGAHLVDRHGGLAPEPGTWTPQHTAFLRLLDTHLTATAHHLGPDGFSLNQAAVRLRDLVADTVRFAAAQAHHPDHPDHDAEDRTTTALQLAAARLLAHLAQPLMPRFSDRLAESLRTGPPRTWPDAVALVPAGTPVELTATTFFAPLDPGE
ncbi:class I tRNA ligase family protein [Streptomyces sp. NPDC047315]|uniref:class I tRNA ligase family protein n=1 Tax=Streptomyces sp. NPDC047315 TaxID=3155142 RepID=UPI0033EF835E